MELLDLKELQKRILVHGNRFMKISKSKNHSLPSHVAFPIFKAIEELGEVSDLLVRKYGLQKSGKEISEEELKERLGEEIVDVITTLVHLANFSEIDLNQSFIKKLQKMEERWEKKEYH